MKTTVLRYHVIIHKTGKQYIADVPTLGISDFGSTIELTKTHIHDAIECHIEGLIKASSPVPPPDAEEFFVSVTQIDAPKAIRFA